MAKNKKTFVTISNREVYDELNKLKENNSKEHEEIMNKIEGYTDQVSRLRYAIGGLFILTIAVGGYFVSHLLKGG